MELRGIMSALGMSDLHHRASSVVSQYTSKGFMLAFVVLLLSVVLVDLAREVITALKLLLADLARAVNAALLGRSWAVSSDRGRVSREESIILLLLVLLAAAALMLGYLFRELRSIKERLTQAPTTSPTSTSATSPTPAPAEGEEIATMPSTPSPTTSSPTAAPAEVATEVVRRDNFQPGKEYALLSSDRTHVLQATTNYRDRRTGACARAGGELFNAIVGNNSSFTIDASVPGGFSLEFKNVGTERLRSPASRFKFSCDPNNRNEYRLRSGNCDYKKMLFMLGGQSPREWVVWTDPDDPRQGTPENGTWELLEMIWDGERVKLKYRGDQYVQWGGGRFTSTADTNAAVEFILREI